MPIPVLPIPLNLMYIMYEFVMEFVYGAPQDVWSVLQRYAGMMIDLTRTLLVFIVWRAVMSIIVFQNTIVNVIDVLGMLIGTVNVNTHQIVYNPHDYDVQADGQVVGVFFDLILIWRRARQTR